MRRLTRALFLIAPIGLSAVVGGCVATAEDSARSLLTPSPATTTPRKLIPDHQRNSAWYQEASRRVSARNADSGARNVILFLGDGMGISTVTAARIYAGQLAGRSGEENRLSFEEFPETGLVKTYNVNSQTPDSAGTMSAIVTGVKTNIGVFGIDENVVANDCESGKGYELVSLLEIAELAGANTGVVSTARVTHATPGATYAKTANRDWEDDSDLSEDAKAAGCVDIASQLLAFEQRLNDRFGAGASNGIEVMLGGGRRHFLPTTETGGRRSDGRNLLSEWSAQNPSGSYVDTSDALADTSQAPVLGLFSPSHMDYAAQQEAGGEQPSLTEMTEKALDLLHDPDKGFLLIVESGRIDHAHHAGNAANALHDTVEFAAAIEAAAKRTSAEDTLILVTADHSHVFTMAGYPRRGNPILGKVVSPWSDEPSLDADGKPYTTLGYINGRGFRDYGDELDADKTYMEPPMPGRHDLEEVDTEAHGYHQEALIPLSAETHGGEDVAVYARGPGARAIAGVNEQNVLFHAMLQSTAWEALAIEKLATGK